MILNLKKMTSATVLGVVIATPSFAGEVVIHGFVRTGYDVTNSAAKYAGVDDNHGDWGSTQAGINFSTVLDAKWSIAAQIHGGVADNELRYDWAIANFQATEEARIIFGRQKYPLGLVTENVDVGVTFPWARPPQELYHLEISSESPNFFVEGFDGISVVYASGDDWEFTAQPFTGQSGYSTTSTDYVRQMNGIKLAAENEMVSLQVGYAASRVTTATVGAVAALSENAKTTINFGAKVEINNFTLMLEAADTQVTNSDEFDTKGAYISVDYLVGRYQPYVYIAQAEGHKATGAAKGKLDQQSVAVGLAYHYKPSIVFKAQWLNVKPDDPAADGLLAALPNGETSVDILSFTVDAVF